MDSRQHDERRAIQYTVIAILVAPLVAVVLLGIGNAIGVISMEFNKIFRGALLAEGCIVICLSYVGISVIALQRSQELGKFFAIGVLILLAGPLIWGLAVTLAIVLGVSTTSHRTNVFSVIAGEIFVLGLVAIVGSGVLALKVKDWFVRRRAGSTGQSPDH